MIIVISLTRQEKPEFDFEQKIFDLSKHKMLDKMDSWVTWAQKWQSGIVKCLTNCPFAAAATTWARGAFAQSWWEDLAKLKYKNTDQNASANTITVYEI